MMVASIEEIVIEAKNGDREAFNELIRSYHKLVWAICYPILKNTVLIEEAVQETFIRVFKELRNIKDTRSFPAWLTTIARNTSIDVQRKEQRKLNTRERFKGQLGSTEQRTERRELVKELLNELPEKYRVPLVLKYLHKLNNVEICGLMSMSEGTLRGILYRGRAMLKALLESELELKMENKREVKDE
ncbi:MAG: RNA polymerase sigma factor [Planctomycetes bacterium]|nr:RNA polymerase sigma factor [Planctomycetota bacterium]